MKALVLTEPGRLEYQEVPEPEVGPDGVLIQVRACGICGSDVHGMDGSTGRRLPPLIMGHEAAGVIAEVGANAQDFTVGERVTFDSTIYCGGCAFCRRGLINLCDRRRVLGVSCAEYRQDGAFAEYVALPARILYRLPEAVSFEQATLVEPLSVALHAVGRTPITLNDTALVLGAGTIGQLVIQCLRLAGCGRIMAVDLDQGRLDLACRLGADVGLRPDAADVPQQVSEQTEGRGAGVCFDAVGLADTLQATVRSVGKGGTITLIGNTARAVELPLQEVVTRQLSLLGSMASCGEYPACLDLIGRGRLNVEALISATAPLSEGAAWFQRLRLREPGLLKVILVP